MIYHLIEHETPSAGDALPVMGCGCYQPLKRKIQLHFKVMKQNPIYELTYDITLWCLVRDKLDQDREPNTTSTHFTTEHAYYFIGLRTCLLLSCMASADLQLLLLCFCYFSLLSPSLTPVNSSVKRRFEVKT